MARVAEDVNLSKDESAMVALLDLNVAKFDGTYVVIDPKVRTKHRKAARYTGSDFGELLKQVVAKRDGQDSAPNGVDNVVSFPTQQEHDNAEAVKEYLNKPEVVQTLTDAASAACDSLIKGSDSSFTVTKVGTITNGKLEMADVDRSPDRVRVEPNTIVDPILDDTGVRVRAPKKEKAKRRDNRYIRAGRFLVENPSMTPAQLSKKADLSYPTAKYTMEAFKAAAFVFSERKTTVAELEHIAKTIEK